MSLWVKVKKKILIDGMKCDHYVAHVKEALVDFAKGEVSLEDKYAVLGTNKN